MDGYCFRNSEKPLRIWGKVICMFLCKDLKNYK